jgi:hypothetical protein
MPAIIDLMTLRQLLEERAGMRAPGDLREKIPEMSRQQAWNLWHGRVSLGLRVAKRISQVTKIPLEELAEVDEAVPGKKRGENISRDNPPSPPPASPIPPRREACKPAEEGAR